MVFSWKRKSPAEYFSEVLHPLAVFSVVRLGQNKCREDAVLVIHNWRRPILKHHIITSSLIIVLNHSHFECVSLGLCGIYIEAMASHPQIF